MHPLYWLSYRQLLFLTLMLELMLIPLKGYSFEGLYEDIPSNIFIGRSAASTRYNFTISEEKKFVWFRVAKVGTRSIYEILAQNKVPFSVDGYKLKFNSAKYQGYFKFGFVRNPWDRVVSCYFNKVVSQAHPTFKECFGKDFDYFIDYINKQDLSSADAHIRLQTKLIPINLVNFVGHIESFEEDLQYVAKVLNLQLSQIPQKNKSRHKHYSKYYTERTRKIIAQKYKDDIEAFGYQFERVLGD